MAVAQLAMKYCDVLVTHNKAYFAPFDFNVAAGSAFGPTAKADMLNPLLTAIMNISLLAKALSGKARTSMNSIKRLTPLGNGSRS